jgi:hypothetical protein
MFADAAAAGEAAAATSTAARATDKMDRLMDGPAFCPPWVYPTASSWDGKSLSQYNLSSATYTNAGSSGGTDWVDNDMTRALNRWIFNGGQTGVL